MLIIINNNYFNCNRIVLCVSIQDHPLSTLCYNLYICVFVLLLFCLVHAVITGLWLSLSLCTYHSVGLCARFAMAVGCCWVVCTQVAPLVASNICFGVVVPLGCFSIGFPHAGPKAVTSARLC